MTKLVRPPAPAPPALGAGSTRSRSSATLEALERWQREPAGARRHAVAARRSRASWSVAGARGAILEICAPPLPHARGRGGHAGRDPPRTERPGRAGGLRPRLARRATRRSAGCSWTPRRGRVESVVRDHRAGGGRRLVAGRGPRPRRAPRRARGGDPGHRGGARHRPRPGAHRRPRPGAGGCAVRGARHRGRARPDRAVHHQRHLAGGPGRASGPCRAGHGLLGADHPRRAGPSARRTSRRTLRPTASRRTTRP